MCLHRADARLAMRFEAPASAYLEPALARLKRQAQYARPLAKDGRAAAGLRTWMNRSAACIAALGRPEAVFVAVSARIVPDGVRIDDRLTLEDDALAGEIVGGGAVTAYLLTLNYAQATAFEWLGGDYGAHHVHSDLANEVLFALGRDAHRRFGERSTAGRLRRIPVRAHAACGQRRVWDPARLQALLGVFGDANPGVRVTGTGCFQPLNTLLGLTVGR